MTRRKAPKGFSSSKIELALISAGALWFRLYSSIYKDPLGFGFSPSRFSDPRIDLPEADRFGVIYLGTSLKVCFLEKVLRDRRNGRLGDIPIPYAELEQLICAELRTVVPLKLIDLRDDRLLQMGIPTDAVRASSHALGQNWSLAFSSHQEQPDGIIYPSRLNQETNLALYDRALAKIELSTVRPFLDYRADVAALIREFRLAIV